MLLIHATAIFMYLLSTVRAQEGTYCTTPLRDPGMCVNIKRCGGLVQLLRSQSNNPEVRSYLLRSTCGYAGTIPLVCCPQADSPQTTPNPRTTPPPPPIVITTTNRAPVTPISSTGRSIDNNYSTESNILRPPNCGFSNDTSTRIVGGVPANLGEFPWAVILGYRNSKNPNQPKWLCGGSLISDRHILTAGHCVHNRQDLYIARMGDLDLYSDIEGASPVTINLVKAKVHENYSPTTFTNDIAILTLERKAEAPLVWPICLPVDEPFRSNTYERNNAMVCGWGALYFNGPSSPTLQKAFLPVVNNPECKKAFANFKTIIDERILCAGVSTGGMDACQGDSGGPLMIGRTEDKSKRFYQIGVVSYGFRCAEKGYPGVYTRVTNFIDWISRNMD